MIPESSSTVSSSAVSSNARGVAHPLAIATAVGAGVLLLAEVFGEWELSGLAHVAGVLVFVLCAAGALAWLPRRPVGAFVVNTFGVFGLVAIGDTSDVYQFTNLIALYGLTSSLAADEGSWRMPGAGRVLGRTSVRPNGDGPWWRSGWLSVIGLLLGIAGIVWYFTRFPDDARGTIFVFTIALLWVAGWLLGVVNGSRLARQQLEDERDVSIALAEARQARLELEASRADMARELHDILGHTLSVMMVHAGAARGALATDPDAAANSLHTIESTGRAAMEDLDRVLGLLGPAASSDQSLSGGSRAPMPGLTELEGLVERFSGGGAVDVSLSIDPALRGANLGRPLQLAVFRVAQEALTNVLKHAKATKVEVDVRLVDEHVTLVVTDNGRGLNHSSTRTDRVPVGHGASSEGVSGRGESGRGVIGMGERARSFGGAVVLEDLSELGEGSGVRLTATFGGVST